MNVGEFAIILQQKKKTSPMYANRTDRWTFSKQSIRRRITLVIYTTLVTLESRPPFTNSLRTAPVSRPGRRSGFPCSSGSSDAWATFAFRPWEDTNNTPLSTFARATRAKRFSSVHRRMPVAKAVADSIPIGDAHGQVMSNGKRTVGADDRSRRLSTSVRPVGRR